MKKKQRLIMRTAILGLLIVIIGYTLYANFTKDEREAAKVGDDAPNFVLKDLEGKEYKLSDYKGKGVFLNFWGTYCEPCKDEMPYINNQYKQYKDQGVEVIAINVGETDLAIKKFAEQYQLSFPIVVDKKGDVQHAYRINPLPATFLINPEGKIIKYYTGPMDEKLVKEFMEMIKP